MRKIEFRGMTNTRRRVACEYEEDDEDEDEIVVDFSLTHLSLELSSSY